MSEDAQLNIFGSAIPLSQLPPLSPCSCDDNCQADADEHMPDCPVEARLLEEFNF